MHAADTAKGIVTASSGLAGLAWITYGNAWSAFCFILTAIGTASCWYITRAAQKSEHERHDREEEAEVERHKRVADALAKIQINDVRVAAMIALLLDKEKDQ